MQENLSGGVPCKLKRWVPYTSSTAGAGEMARWDAFLYLNIGCSVSSSTTVKVLQKDQSGDGTRKKTQNGGRIRWNVSNLIRLTPKKLTVPSYCNNCISSAIGCNINARHALSLSANTMSL